MVGLVLKDSFKIQPLTALTCFKQTVKSLRSLLDIRIYLL